MHSTKRANLEALRRHVERLERRLGVLDRLNRRYAWTRPGLVLGGAVAAFLAFQAVESTGGWIVVGSVVLAFLVTAHFHRRVDDSIRRHQIWQRIKAAHVARMTLDWPALPQRSSWPPDLDHPFENDLYLTGRRSLHHLLDTACTPLEMAQDLVRPRSARRAGYLRRPQPRLHLPRGARPTGFGPRRDLRIFFLISVSSAAAPTSGRRPANAPPG